MIFDTKFHGIPCQCEVTYSSPIVPAITDGPPDNWAPAEGGDFEFNILDRKGRRALWLERKLTKADPARLEEEASLEAKSEEFADPF